jgi:hypothetical protein
LKQCDHLGDLKQWLGNEGKYFPNPAFDCAVFKVISGETLTADEAALLKSFEVVSTIHVMESDEESEEDSYVARPVKKQRADTAYPDSLRWIPPTSNVVERLFSLARLSLGDLRKSMTPMHLEGLVYLKCNKDLWDLAFVDKIVKKVPSLMAGLKFLGGPDGSTSGLT